MTPPTLVIVVVIGVCVLDLIIYKLSKEPDPFFEQLGSMLFQFSFLVGCFLAFEVIKTGIEYHANSEIALSGMTEQDFLKFEESAIAMLWLFGLSLVSYTVGFIVKRMSKSANKSSPPQDDSVVDPL